MKKKIKCMTLEMTLPHKETKSFVSYNKLTLNFIGK